MWKNPIFQERKKNVKNPIFQERKKISKNPIFQERKKHVNQKFSSPEIFTILIFEQKKISRREILSIWKKSFTQKKKNFKWYLPTSWLFFPQKKKKNFFFSGTPKFLKSLRRTYQVIKESPLRRLLLRKKFFSRALTKRLTAILRPFLESSGSHKKSFL